MIKQKTFWAKKPFGRVNHLWVARYCTGWSTGYVSTCGLKEPNTQSNVSATKCKNCLRAIKS